MCTPKITGAVGRGAVVVAAAQAPRRPCEVRSALCPHAHRLARPAAGGHGRRAVWAGCHGICLGWGVRPCRQALTSASAACRAAHQACRSGRPPRLSLIPGLPPGPRSSRGSSAFSRLRAPQALLGPGPAPLPPRAPAPRALAPGAERPPRPPGSIRLTGR